MKKNICCILSSLILVCVVYICLSSSTTTSFGNINVDSVVKYVDSEVLLTGLDVDVKESGVSDLEVEETIDIEEPEVLEESIVLEEKEVREVVVEKKEEVKVESNVEMPVSNNEIITGKMTGYGPDCSGCSGYLANGMYVGDGTIYYNDSEYGKVRIVAGDKKYRFGTIVKINDSMIAIVLDRGGSIGIGKKFLFDLLYSSEKEASNHGVMNDVKFEILRNGF